MSIYAQSLWNLPEYCSGLPFPPPRGGLITFYIKWFKYREHILYF